MVSVYNVSANQSALCDGEWSFFTDQVTAQNSAIAEARSTGTTHYVHDVTFRPIFKAEVVATVSTEVM